MLVAVLELGESRPRPRALGASQPPPGIELNSSHTHIIVAVCLPVHSLWSCVLPVNNIHGYFSLCLVRHNRERKGFYLCEERKGGGNGGKFVIILPHLLYLTVSFLACPS